MTIQPTIFGGATGRTYEDIKRTRAIAEQLMKKNSRTPRNLGEGISSMGNAVVAAILRKRASKAEEAGQSQYGEAFSNALQSQSLVDISNAYGSPYANDLQKDMLRARLQKLPHYQHGTPYHPGGAAVVGEQAPEMIVLPDGRRMPAGLLGPEVVNMPQGSAVVPPDPNAPQDMGQVDPYGSDYNAVGARSYTPQGQPQPPRQMGQPMPMTPQLDPSLMPGMDVDPRGMFWQEDAQLAPRPGSSFLPGAEYRTAQEGYALDAYKLLSQEPQYDLSNIPGGKLTEQQSKLVSYLRKAMIADAMLDDPKLTQAMTRMDNAVASKLGGLGRLYTDSDYEIGRLAADLFSTALLRKESGAQTPEPEVARYRQMYAPLSNETDAEISAKSAIRKQEIRALQAALGTALPVGELIYQEVNALKDAARQRVSDEDLFKEYGIE